MSKEEARKRLEIIQKEKVLLFFGYVREYKGLKYLLQAMPLISAKEESIRLFVAGEFGSDREEYRQLISKLGIQGRVSIVDRYMPDREVEQYFAAADLVVLPYVSATQSGIVQVAYGFTKPVVVTDVGGLPDVVDDGKTGYVVEPERPEAIAEAVLDFYRNGKENLFEENIRKEAYRFSWERMGEVVDGMMD